MNYTDFIKAIEAEWEPESGFFWKVRQGDFDAQAFARLREKLRTRRIDDDAELPRRLVSVLWYIPLFMSWQVDRVRESSSNASGYEEAVTAATNEIERLLGLP